MAIAKVLDGEPFGAGSLADVPAPEPDEDDIAVLDATCDDRGPDVLIEINHRAKVDAVRKLFPGDYHCYSIDDANPRVRSVGRFSAPFDNRNFLFSTRPAAEVAALADWADRRPGI